MGRVIGFIGGGCNIAIATALPPSSFVYCIVNIKQFMEFLYLIFSACLRLRFLDVETNPCSLRPDPAVCSILCSNVRGLAGNLSDLTVASSQYDIPSYTGGLVIALEITGMSLSITRGGPMLYMPRLCVSLVSEAGMF